MNKEKNKNEENTEKHNIDNKNINIDDQNIESTNISEEENLIKIGQLENEIALLKDQLLRKAAEFENYKRRTENEQLSILKYSAESFITKLLPIVDDFERSLQHMETAKDTDSLKKGVALIYEKLMKLLNEQGVKKIEAVGKPFDVEYHEAMLQRKDDSVDPHTVLDEIETGYIYKDRVIRHAKVIVSEDQLEDSTET